MTIRLYAGSNRTVWVATIYFATIETLLRVIEAGWGVEVVEDDHVVRT